MARLSVVCPCVLLVLVSSYAVNSAPSRERRSPTLGLASAIFGAILEPPAAILSPPEQSFGQASYGPGNGPNFGGGYGGPVDNNQGNVGSGYDGGLPGVSLSFANSFSIGDVSAQSSASSSASEYGK